MGLIKTTRLTNAESLSLEAGAFRTPLMSFYHWMLLLDQPPIVMTPPTPLYSHSVSCQYRFLYGADAIQPIPSFTRVERDEVRASSADGQGYH